MRMITPNVSALKDVDIIAAIRQATWAFCEKDWKVEPERKTKTRPAMLTPMPRTAAGRRNAGWNTVFGT